MKISLVSLTAMTVHLTSRGLYQVFYLEIDTCLFSSSLYTIRDPFRFFTLPLLHFVSMKHH